MKILVVSDTHGYNNNLLRALEREKTIDKLIHLGDFESKIEIENMVRCGAIFLPGNNDYSTDLDRERILNIEGNTIFLVHGDRHGVGFGYDRISYAAESKGASIAMFGHTHKPLIDIEGRVTLINPGSLTYPRQEGFLPSYIVMNLNQDGIASYELKYLD